MNPRPGYSLDRSVRRVLLRRLAAVALGISVVLGSYVYLLERNDVGESLVEYTFRRAELFNAKNYQVLDAPELPSPEVFQSRLEAFHLARYESPLGRFVSIRVRDLDQRPLASVPNLVMHRRMILACWFNG